MNARGPIPVHMIVSHTTPNHNCLLCAFNQHGYEKVNGVGHNVGVTAAAHDEHEGTVGHDDREQAGRRHLPHVAQRAMAPGSIYEVGRGTNRHRCVICSLDRNGNPRHQFNNMDSGTVMDHVGGEPHGRRVLDGRYGGFLQTGRPWQ